MPCAGRRRTRAPAVSWARCSRFASCAACGATRTRAAVIAAARSARRWSPDCRHAGRRQPEPGADECRPRLEILAGKFDLVLITGAENGNSSGKARRAGVSLEQTPAPGKPDAGVRRGAASPSTTNTKVAKGIRRAIQVYPMYDNALASTSAASPSRRTSRARLFELWSRFNDVAQDNPNAWVRDNMTAEEIRTPSSRNRQISFPVHQVHERQHVGGHGRRADRVQRSRRPRRLGIAAGPSYVYPHSGVEGYDHFSASVRDNFHTSPGVRITGTRAMALAGIDVGDLRFRRPLQLLPVGSAGRRVPSLAWRRIGR